mgnify:CR=1 FL=1
MDAYVMRIQKKMVIIEDKSRQLDMKKTQEVKPIAPTVMSSTKHSPKLIIVNNEFVRRTIINRLINAVQSTGLTSKELQAYYVSYTIN